MRNHISIDLCYCTLSFISFFLAELNLKNLVWRKFNAILSAGKRIYYGESIKNNKETGLPGAFILELPPRGLRLKIQFTLDRTEAGNGGGRVTWLAGHFMAHRVHAKIIRLA